MKQKKTQTNLQFKRLIRRYEYVMADVNDIEAIYSEAGQAFSQAINGLNRDDVFESKEMEQMAEEHAQGQEEAEELDERDSAFKKLFRKIVVKCHPDKLPDDMAEAERNWHKERYEQAVEANDGYNWPLLIIIAGQLGIEPPPEAEEHVENIEEQIKKLEQKSQQMMSAVAWTWYHAGDDVIRERIMQEYVKHMEKRVLKRRRGSKKILVVGHPRTGTGYTAKLLQSWGLDVWHERLGEDGISHWGLAAKEAEPVIFADPDFPDLSYESFDWQCVIYCVRDPKHSIPSIVYTEDTASESLNYRSRYGGFRVGENGLVNAVNSLTAWDRLVQQINPGFTFRIEDGHRELFEWLVAQGLDVTWSDKMIGVKWNRRDHPGWEDLEVLQGGLHKRERRQLNEMAKRLGYSPVL